MSNPGVQRIARIGLTVGELDGVVAFYRDALGFREVGRETRGGPGFAALMGG